MVFETTSDYDNTNTETLTGVSVFSIDVHPYCIATTEEVKLLPFGGNPETIIIPPEAGSDIRIRNVHTALALFSREVRK